MWDHKHIVSTSENLLIVMHIILLYSFFYYEAAVSNGFQLQIGHF